jgi:hypothetical protein
MNLRVLTNIVSPLALSALLAACGGGGGSSTVPAGGGGPATHAALRAGFSGIGRGGAALTRRPLDVASLTGSLVPIANFMVPDSYVTLAPFSITGTTAVAFYDPATGTVPSPLPTVAWSHSGIATTLGTPQVPVTISNASVAGESFATAPSVTGTGTITGVASNGVDSITLTFNAYGGAGISTTSNSNGFSPCITFASGHSTPGTTGDICLVTNGDGTTSVSAPLGAVLVQKPIDAVAAADAALVPSSATLIPTVSIIPGSGVYTVVAHTTSGSLVKWEPASNQGTDTLAGKITLQYGPYRFGSPVSGWDF